MADEETETDALAFEVQPPLPPPQTVYLLVSNLHPQHFKDIPWGKLVRAATEDDLRALGWVPERPAK